MEREELHRRIELFQENLKEGKIKFAPHLIDGFRESLKKVRLSPDGLVDPESVDGRIRAACMMIAHIDDRQEWKKAISLQEIQDAYFKRVTHAFGQPFELMVKENADPYVFAGFIASDDKRVKECVSTIDAFLSEIAEFWKNISDPTWIHLEDTLDSKAIFTGELFPDASSNVASSTGLYFDTTVLPDPFLKIQPLIQFMDNKEKCYQIIRLALQVLSYKALALADIEKPVIAILPDRHGLDENYKKFVNDCAVADSIEHTKHIFGLDIADNEELMDFYMHFGDAEEIVSQIKKPDKLVFATEWDGTLSEQIMRFLDEEGEKLQIERAGQAVYMQLVMRFSQANDSFQRSRQLRGTPIIRAETSWIWYNHMLEHNAGNSNEGSLNDLHIARALNSTVKTEIPWIGNIPPDALIEIRKAGAMEEIRYLLDSGIKNLIEANPKNFFRTGDQVFENLDKAFRDHEVKINELISKRWKFAGRDFGSFVVVGGIEVAAALTGLPIFGVTSVAAGMTGAIPNVKDLKEKYKNLRAEESEINNTGIGILLKNKNA